jgi:hypothetical protein
LLDLGAPQRRQCRLSNTLVNFKYSHIFNGIFKTQKSSKNEQKFAETRLKKMQNRRLYHDRFNHDERIRQINCLLMNDVLTPVPERLTPSRIAVWPPGPRHELLDLVRLSFRTS